MLFKTRDMLGATLVDQNNGEFGKINDFFFDDITWRLRYAVVDTGNWLNVKEILISPASFLDYDPKIQVIATNLKQSQIKDAPAKETLAPISRQYEEALSGYYNWPSYWQEPLFPGIGVYAFPFPPDDIEHDAELDTMKSNRDPHLKSVVEILGYAVDGEDAHAGLVDDLLLHRKDWSISYVTVDTGSLLFHKKVVVDISWIDEIDWYKRKLRVLLSTNDIKHSLAIEAKTMLNKTFEEQLINFHETLGNKWREKQKRLVVTHKKEREELLHS